MHIKPRHGWFYTSAMMLTNAYLTFSGQGCQRKESGRGVVLFSFAAMLPKVSFYTAH